MYKIPAWDDFYEATKDRPPRQILIDAVKHVERSGLALDIGAGALNETKFLLKQGFEVTAIDSEPTSAKAARALANPKLHFHRVSYEKFSFPKQEYDLVAAIYALPFTPPEYFDKVMRSVLSSVKPGGVFAGHFYGEHDEWNSGTTNMSFVSKSAIQNYFKEFEMIDFDEREGEESADTGGTKYWHIFQIIARRK